VYINYLISVSKSYFNRTYLLLPPTFFSIQHLTLIRLFDGVYTVFLTASLKINHKKILSYCKFRENRWYNTRISSKVQQSELLGFWALFIVRYSEKYERTQRFGNCICLRPKMKRWETPTLLVPLERVIAVDPFKRTQQIMCLPPIHLRTETEPIYERFCSLEYRMMDKLQKPSSS
jgi:hypothetical protein